MRYQGRITEWNDGRGFGFVTPGGGGERVFLHVSAFRARPRRPQVGDSVTYDLLPGDRGGKAGDVVMVLAATGFQPAPRPRPAPRRARLGWLAVPALVAGAAFLWQRIDVDGNPPPALLSSDADTARFVASPPATNAAFRCEGKRHCSEMTSCAEAMFYLQSCPGSVTDGDGDGRPCEDQWCGH